MKKALHILPRFLVSLIIIISCSPSGQYRLSNDAVRVVLDSRDGHVISILDRHSGVEMVDSAASGGALWHLFSSDGEVMENLEGASFGIRRVSASEAVLRWEMADSGVVELSLRLDPYEAMTYWSLDVSGSGTRGFTNVEFPVINGLRAAPGEKLAVSNWQGTLYENLREGLDEDDVKHLTWQCPGDLNMQLVALYGDGAPGFYFSSDDTLSLSKTYALDLGRRHTSFHIDELLCEDASRDSYHSSYEVVLGLFEGDWHQAALIYRKSAERMPWFRESRAGAGKTAEWARKTPLWIWNRQYASNVLDEAADLQDFLGGIPVSVLWHWWHGCSYDEGFPEYIPPRDGAERFTEALSAAGKRGINALVYMNSIQWGNTTKSWEDEGAAPYRVRKRDGSDWTHVFNIFSGRSLTPMCMATDFWKNKYSSLCDTVLNSYGAGGIYMDQACLSFDCYDPSHGHPLGGGNYWVTHFGRLTGMIRDIHPDAVLAGEGSGETWMPYLDLFLTLEASRERYAGIQSIKTIPLFQAVYHDRAICFGSYASLVYPPYDDKWPDEFRPANRETELPEEFNSQFRMEQARSFVWGTQPMIANYHSFLRETRPRELEYLKRIVLTRMNAFAYLGEGICAGSPPVPSEEAVIPVSRTNIYAGRYGSAVTRGEITSPVLFSEGWKSASGGYAIAVTNISDCSQPLKFSVNPADYGISGRYDVFLIDSQGRSAIGESRKGILDIDTDIAGLDAIVIEITQKR